MIEIFICEDQVDQRQGIEKVVKDYIMMEELEMSISLSTADPYKVLSYIEGKPQMQGLFFLDMDLQADINGLQLGQKIRQALPNGKIVFITTHNEFLELTFIHKVEALDYIMKDDRDMMAQRIREALQETQSYYLKLDHREKEMISLKVGQKLRLFSLSEVMFFATSPVPHKLELHLQEGILDFYGKITEVEQLAIDLKRVHHSFVVNQKNIVSIDKQARALQMKNGEVCIASTRFLKNLDFFH